MAIGDWTQEQICPNQPYGQHIVVRCAGCGSRHSTKNIGSRNSEHVVSLARNLHDIFEMCKCKDPTEFPVVHDCAVDDVDWDYKTKTFVAIKKMDVGNLLREK